MIKPYMPTYLFMTCAECKGEIIEKPGVKYVFLNGIKVTEKHQPNRMPYKELQKTKDCFICWECWQAIAPDRLMLDMDKDE